MDASVLDQCGRLNVTRYPEQSVILSHPDLGPLARVTVARVGESKARLIFQALPELEIVRDELLAGWRGRRCDQ